MTKPPERTTADTQPFGYPEAASEPDAPEAAAEGEGAGSASAESTNTELGFAHRTALALREKFPAEVLEVVTFRGEWTVTVEPDRILEVLGFLRDQWNYKMCHDVTSVDLYPKEPRFMVVYHLLNLDRATRIRVKAPVSGEHPEIASAVPLWKGANFMEREVYDLMGIRFKGHPDLRRILMADDWEGHPMRKDYPLTGSDVGVDTVKD
jgi:NADH-quinone oxidoreductase subunit C